MTSNACGTKRKLWKTFLGHITWLRPEQGHETTEEDRYFFETILAFLKSRLDIEKHEFISQEINRDWAMTFQTNQPLNISLVNLFVGLFWSHYVYFNSLSINSLLT